jgi:hypothetical protein
MSIPIRIILSNHGSSSLSPDGVIVINTIELMDKYCSPPQSRAIPITVEGHVASPAVVIGISLDRGSCRRHCSMYLLHVPELYNSYLSAEQRMILLHWIAEIQPSHNCGRLVFTLFD